MWTYPALGCVSELESIVVDDHKVIKCDSHRLRVICECRQRNWICELLSRMATIHGALIKLLKWSNDNALRVDQTYRTDDIELG